jgi:hypothetical protein
VKDKQASDEQLAMRFGGADKASSFQFKQALLQYYGLTEIKAEISKNHPPFTKRIAHRIQ